MFIEDLRKVFVPANPLFWLLLAVAAYVFLAPNVDFAPRLTWHDGQRLGQLTLLAVAIVLMLGVPSAAWRVSAVWLCLSGIVRWTLTGVLGLGALSSLLAQQPRWAFLEWGVLLLLAMLALGVAAGRRELGEKADPVLVLLFFATACAYAVKTAAVYVSMLLVGPDYGLVFDLSELYTGFSNVRIFGHVQTMLVPFLVIPAMWWSSTWVRRVLLWSIPAIWWMLVIGSGTRGTWIALLLGGIAVYLFGNQAGRRWIRWQIAALSCGLAFYVIFVLLIPRLMSFPATFLYRSNDIVSLSGREVLWSASLGFSAAYPWLGVGPMHFADTWNPVAAHPHGALLQLMAEWGLPAALMLILVLAAGGLSWALRIRAETAARAEAGRQLMVGVALLAALTGAAAQAMVDGVIVMPVSQTLLALLAGWALGQYIQISGTPVTRTCRRQLAVVVLVFSAACAVVNGVMPDINRIEQREKAYFESRPPGEILLPRFWAQGWIYK